MISSSDILDGIKGAGDRGVVGQCAVRFVDHPGVVYVTGDECVVAATAIKGAVKCAIDGDGSTGDGIIAGAAG